MNDLRREECGSCLQKIAGFWDAAGVMRMFSRTMIWTKGIISLSREPLSITGFRITWGDWYNILCFLPTLTFRNECCQGGTDITIDCSIPLVALSYTFPHFPPNSCSEARDQLLCWCADAPSCTNQQPLPSNSEPNLLHVHRNSARSFSQFVHQQCGGGNVSSSLAFASEAFARIPAK